MRRFARPISPIAQVTNVFQGALAAAVECLNLESEDDVVEPKPALLNEKGLVVDLRANVTFDHVRFGYNLSKLLLMISRWKCRRSDGCDCGTDGSGQTTLVKLLMRFYELNAARYALTV